MNKDELIGYMAVAFTESIANLRILLAAEDVTLEQKRCFNETLDLLESRYNAYLNYINRPLLVREKVVK